MTKLIQRLRELGAKHGNHRCMEECPICWEYESALKESAPTLLEIIEVQREALEIMSNPENIRRCARAPKSLQALNSGNRALTRCDELERKCLEEMG